MIDPGNILDKDQLNRAYLSKFMTGTQIILGSISMSGGIIVGGNGNATTTFSVDKDGDLNFKNGALFAQYSTARVGIGTTAPTGRLTIYGSEATASGEGAAITLKNIAAGGGTWYIRAGATGTGTPAGGLSIGDPTTYRISITSAGNVGIGTTTPLEKLHVAGKIQVDTSVKVANKFEILYNSTEDSIDFMFL